MPFHALEATPTLRLAYPIPEGIADLSLGTIAAGIARRFPHIQRACRVEFFFVGTCGGHPTTGRARSCHGSDSDAAMNGASVRHHATGATAGGHSVPCSSDVIILRECLRGAPATGDKNGEQK